MELWFKEADTKNNGRIEGDEAVAFFSRTDLQDEDLSKMWRYAVPSGEHCMSKTHFINALKLVAVLQVRKKINFILHKKNPVFQSSIFRQPVLDLVYF